jgi:hypothetical protein
MVPFPQASPTTIQHTKGKFVQSFKKWESEVMHGQYIGSTDTELIGEEGGFLWLPRGDTTAEN